MIPSIAMRVPGNNQSVAIKWVRTTVQSLLLPTPVLTLSKLAGNDLYSPFTTAHPLSLSYKIIAAYISIAIYTVVLHTLNFTNTIMRFSFSLM